jgi:pimeloyl-ACP methyl ester carboxylesterase
VGRLLRWLAILVTIALVVQFVVIPVGFGIAATAAPRASVGAAPEGFVAVPLNTAEGDRLSAWYAAPKNGAVILLLHGAGGSRESVRGYAQMLVDGGFGVLALDLRGHGESEGQINLYGWQSTEDVRAAIAYLRTQNDVRTIGGLGLSLGGEALLGAASENPQLLAIVAEGATARSFAEHQALPHHANPISGFQPWVAFTTVRLITGQTPPRPILESIRDTKATRFLFIAAENDEDEGEFSTIFAEAAKGRAEVWIVPGVGHVGGYGRYPDEYKMRVLKFFTKTLLTG